MYSLKPPVLPRPCTGGGGTAKMAASWMVLNFLLSVATMAPADRSFVVRSSKGFSGKNSTAALLKLTKPCTDRPVKPIA